MLGPILRKVVYPTFIWVETYPFVPGRQFRLGKHILAKDFEGRHPVIKTIGLVVSLHLAAHSIRFLFTPEAEYVCNSLLDKLGADDLMGNWHPQILVLYG